MEKNWNRWKNDRKEGEKEYRKKLEKSLEWNERDEQKSKKIWGDEKEVPLEAEPQKGGTFIGHLNTNNFYFIFLFFYFSNFILIFLFSFSFLLDDEEARDTEVT